MEKKKLFLMFALVCLLAACGTSRKAVVGVSGSLYEHATITKYDSAHAVTESVDSSTFVSVDTSHVRQAVADRGTYDETIAERITETIDKEGRKTTTTDRTIHRKGDYERNATYEAQLKHQEEIISKMQHTIDSLALGNSLNVDTHWAKKDSSNVEKETNTKDIKPASTSKFIAIFLFWSAAIGIVVYLYNKR